MIEGLVFQLTPDEIEFVAIALACTHAAPDEILSAVEEYTPDEIRAGVKALATRLEKETITQFGI